MRARIGVPSRGEIMTGPGAVTIMNRPVPIGTHICAFYSGPTGRDELVMPFLAEGIRAGHKCI